MPKSTKYILLTLFILAVTGLLAAGLFLNTFYYHSPLPKKVPIQREPAPADPETLVDERVMKAGDDLMEEKAADGTTRKYHASFYTRYLAADGTYQPIDAKLVKSSQADYTFENTKNVFQSYFKSDAASPDLVKYQVAGDRAVSFSFIGANKASATTNDNTVTYADALSGLDAKYTVSSEMLLEELIAKKKIQIDKVSQQLNLQGVYFKEEANGTLTFHDNQTKAIVFYAAKPMMYEQNDTSKKNYGLHYEIEEPDGGFIISKVIDQAGQDWLGQANYPVVIDFSFYPVPPSNPYIRPPTGTTSLTLQFTGNAFPTGAVNPYYIVQGSTDGTTWADVCDVPASVSGTVACANVPANSVTCSSGTCSATTSGVYQVIQNSLGINSKHYFRVGTYMTLSFGTGGQLALGVSDIAADATFVYDSHLGTQWGIEKRYAVTGQLDTTFGTSGVATVTTGTVSAITKDATYIYVAGIISGSSPANQWFVEKRLLSTGALVTAFDGDGILLLPRYTSVSDIIVDGSFVYIAGGDNSSGSSRGFVEKRNIGNGTAAAGYSFVLNAALIASNRIAIDASSIYITGIYASGSSRCWGGEKRVIGTGALDTTFLGTGSFIETGGTNCIGVVSSTTAVALDATNAYFVGGYGKVEKRLKTTGALVTVFDGDGMKTSTVVYRINDAFISGSSLYIAGDAQTSIALVAEILNSTTGASAGSMTSQRAWSPIEMVYDSGSYVYVADTSIVEKRNLSNLTLVSPVDCSPRSNCLSAANGDWRSSSPIFRYTRPLGVQTAMSSSLVFSSPDWQTIQIDSGTIPTYSINPANTHYCLGVSFGTDWPAVSGPDTLYSTSASLLFPGAALVYPKISETGFSQDWVDDVLAAPIQAACYTQAGWNTPTKLPWEIDGDYSSGMRFAPDRAYTLGMYSQNGQNELSPNNNPVCSTGSGSYTTQAACTAGGGSWLYSADNYVWPTSLPATHYKTIYTRARNAPVPTVTALSTTQLNVVMDSSCGSSNSSNANTTDYALYNSSTSQYYNISTPGFDGTEHWYDCNNGSGTWNGTTGVTVSASSPNTCYTLQSRTRNGDSLCGETSAGSCSGAINAVNGWSGSTGTLVCTLAAVPGISVSCNYNSTDQYFCNATVSANGNPAGTQYQVEMYDTAASSWTVVQAWGTGTSVKKTSLMCRYSPVQFRVKARNTSGTETAYSTGSDTLPPCPPLSFAVAGRQIASMPPLIAWSWSAPISGVAPTSYNFYDTSDSSKNQTGVTSIYYETVDPNTQHTAYATAVANGKEGAPSNTASTWEYAMTPGITLNCTTKQVSITTGTDPYYNPSTTQYHLQYTTDGGTTWIEADSGWQTYTETSHVITRAFNGAGCNLTYQYRVKARNGADEEAPSGASWSTSNTCTMPPDPPTWSSPNHSTQTTSSITWQWTAPGCAVAPTGYNVYDCSNNKKNSSLIGATSWAEPSLATNTSYCRKLTAVGSTGLESSASAQAAAYSHIQSVSIASILPDVTALSVSTTTPSNLASGNSGVQIYETTGWYSSWQKSVGFSRTGLSPNTNYCYQARSRNGDNLVANDMTSLSSQSCKYTYAAVPARPNIQSLSGGIQVRLTLGAESPQNPGATQYAVCVTRYNSDGSKNSKYAFSDDYDGINDGVTTVNWGVCGNPVYTTESDCTANSQVWGYCSNVVYQNDRASCVSNGGSWLSSASCVSSDSSGHWARRDTGAAPNWGNTNGVVITGLNASTKYDFKAKARNADNVATAFGPQATLFLVKNNVVGWAWSSNIGWLSMNCLNMFINPSQYGYSCSNASDWGMNTEFEATREINPLEGYAWSASGQELKTVWSAQGKNINNYVRGHGLAYDGTYLWVVRDDDDDGPVDYLLRIKPSDASYTDYDLVSKAAGSGEFSDVEYDGRYIWATSANDDKVYKIDPTIDSTGNYVVGSVGVGSLPVGLAYGGDFLWVTDGTDNTVKKVDVDSNTVVDTYAVGAKPNYPEFDGRYLWVPNKDGGNISRIDSTKGSATAGAVTNYALGVTTPYEAAFDGQYVWVTYRGGVKVIDRNGAEIQNISLGAATDYMLGLEYHNGYMWADNSTGNAVYQISSASRQVMNTYGSVNTPKSIIAVGNNLWTTNYASTNIVTEISQADSPIKIGLGWVSFYQYICANNTQKGCSALGAASVECGGAVGNDCIEKVGAAEKSAGTPQSGPTYGYCYNASNQRYGVCSTSGTCTENNVTSCTNPTTAHCVFETCRSDVSSCSSSGTCRAASLANYNGNTREIEGWGRSLTLKEEGLKHDCDSGTPGLQPCTDWGWLKLGGTYGGATPGSYKLTGSEVDSQSFLGDPDVNPNNVTLYSMFGWSWQGQGTANTNTGWFEFMPVGALLGIPWVKTAYSDIYAGQNIALASPPRGSGEYTSTFLILADGTIQGVSGYYSGSLTAAPTSGYYEPGFNPLITNAGQPLGANALAKIDVDGLVQQVNSTTKDKYGYEVVNYSAGNLSDASRLGQTPVLNGKVYYVNGDAAIDTNPITFQKGDSTLITPTTGNGLIVVDGDLEINQNIYYEKRCTDGSGAQTTVCQSDDDCTAGLTCQTAQLANISEMPSAAIIVRGNIYINPMVTRVSAVTVAADDPATAAITEGTISTGRKKTVTKTITVSADDSYVVYNGSAYTNNPASGVAQFGSPAAGSTSRAFLRFPMTGIPAGAEIKNAYLKLTGDGNACANFNSRIYLIDSDNVGNFSSTTAPAPANLYNSATSNSVSFPLAAWSASGVNQTPDVKALVQRYLSSDNYNPSNYIGFEINEGDAAALQSCNFIASDDPGINNEPQLVIEYAPQRKSYNIAVNSDDVQAQSGAFNDQANLQLGWVGAAYRTYLRFAGIDLPPEAEIIQAHIRATISGSGSTGFQVRQGLLDGYPATFTANPWNAALATGISEVAEDVATGSWANGSTVVMRDIAEIIESFIARTDYVSGFALSMRLRRGSDSVEATAGLNEYRYIANQASKLEVDYRVPLYVSGLFVAKGYNFDRKYTKNLAASEQIVYDGRVVANTPPGLTDFAKSLPIYQKVTP